VENNNRKGGDGLDVRQGARGSGRPRGGFVVRRVLGWEKKIFIAIAFPGQKNSLPQWWEKKQSPGGGKEIGGLLRKNLKEICGPLFPFKLPEGG